MFIPHDQLQPRTLQALIEEFITRDGAVHGHQDTPLDRMIAQVNRQLRTGQVAIVYDEESETCTIVPVDKPAKSPRSSPPTDDPDWSEP